MNTVNKLIVLITSWGSLLSCSPKMNVTNKVDDHSKHLDTSINIGMPIIRTYPQIKNSKINSENLNFFKIMVVNSPDSPEIIMYNVNKYYFRIGNEKFENKSANLSKISLNTIYNLKPSELFIDSIEVKTKDSIFYIKSNLKLSIDYSNYDKFKCFNDNQTFYDFKTIISKNENSFNINFPLSLNTCNILLFKNLGTTSNVKVFDLNGSILYNQNILMGEKFISNYMNFEGYNDLKIEIIGDFNWNGIIHFVK